MPTLPTLDLENVTGLLGKGKNAVLGLFGKASPTPVTATESVETTVSALPNGSTKESVVMKYNAPVPMPNQAVVVGGRKRRHRKHKKMTHKRRH